MTTLVGAAAFAGMGLLIAGTVRPEAALVLANALFLVALMVGGVLVPVEDLPGPLASIAGLLPVGALAEAFRASLGSGGSLAINLGIVAAWGAAALVGAARTFRWELSQADEPGTSAWEHRHKNPERDVDAIGDEA
jgi:ABC-2 type transport system permease protein